LGQKEEPMTHTNERDLRRIPNDLADAPRPSLLAGTLLPLIVAAALAAIVVAMVYQGPTTERVGDTNAGPSVQTVTPAPSPTTEPRPTQAPQP
jgi:hypothetical protein